jgi:catechol 2,3-dioxygenase-like lactoylglutathione lyase family enzyme
MTSPPAAPSGEAFRGNADLAIHVLDLARADAFYGGVLGFRVVERGDEHLAFDAGAFRLWVNRDTEARSFIPSLDVPDVAGARRRLEEAGCTVVRVAEDGSGFYFRDPFGFVVDVIRRRDEVPPA